MKVEIDTLEKTIVVFHATPLVEIVDLLKKIDDWKEYSIRGENSPFDIDPRYYDVTNLIQETHKVENE